MAGGHDGDAQVDEAALVLDAEAAVLRDAALGDVQVAEDFDTRNQIGVPFLGHVLHGILQDAVDAVLDGDFAIAGFDVNVTGAAFEGGEDDGFNEANDWILRGVAREAIAGDGFVALDVVFGDLQGEGFGGLLEYALRLLGALEQIVDLALGGDFDGKLFAEQQG